MKRRAAFHLLSRLCSTAPETHSALVDRFARRHTYLRISLTERCNLRCTYCMPEDGVPLSPSSELLSTPEIVALASLFGRLGVRKIRLTGGEPSLRKDLPHLVRELASLPGIEVIDSRLPVT